MASTVWRIICCVCHESKCGQCQADATSGCKALCGLAVARSVIATFIMHIYISDADVKLMTLMSAILMTSRKNGLR